MPTSPSHDLLDLLTHQGAPFSHGQFFEDPSDAQETDSGSAARADIGAGIGLHIHAPPEQAPGSHHYSLRSHDGHSHSASGECHAHDAGSDASAANTIPPVTGDDDASIGSVEYIVPASVSFPKPLVIRPPPWWLPLVRSPLRWVVALLLLAMVGGIWAAGGPVGAARIARSAWVEWTQPLPGLTEVRLALT